MQDKFFKDYFDERNEQSDIANNTKILVKTENNDVEKLDLNKLTPSGGYDGTAQNLKDRTEVLVTDFGAVGDGVTDDTTAFQAAIDYSSATGFPIHIKAGTYVIGNVKLKPQCKLYGAGRLSTKLLFKNYDTTGTYSSMFEREDNTDFVSYIEIKDMAVGTAFSSTAAAQDANPKAIGFNLFGCPYARIINVACYGFGYGCIVMGRMEGGSEGMGYTNTHDGNYIELNNIFHSACGKYNPEEASIWLKYKANSNKFFSLYAKGAIENCIVITYGGDNAVFGGTAESASIGIVLKPQALNNAIYSFRGEGLSTATIEVHEQSNTLLDSQNTIVGLHNSSAPEAVKRVGNPFVTVLSGGRFFEMTGRKPFTNLNTTSDYNYLKLLGLLTTDEPLYVKRTGFNEGNHATVQFQDTNVARSSGDSVGDIDFFNNDASGGARGINARIRGKVLDGVGTTGVSIFSGKGGTMNEVMELGTHAKIPDGTWNGKHFVLGSLHIWQEGSNLRLKNGAPTSATDGTVIS